MTDKEIIRELEQKLSNKRKECDELFTIAKKNNLVLMEAIKTLYSASYASEISNRGSNGIIQLPTNLLNAIDVSISKT